jgi:magnesium chelatase subunit I
MKEIIAEITHLARKSADIGQRSGVSVRVSIANQETVVSNAVRRAVRLGEKMAVPRISDLGYIIASTTGKVELESFEDTDERKLIDELVKKAVLAVFNRYYRADQLEDIVKHFSNHFNVETSDALASQSYVKSAREIAGMSKAVKQVNASDTPEMVAAAVEFILEGLHLNKRLNKASVNGKTVYKR